jgi:hypothetical protein
VTHRTRAILGVVAAALFLVVAIRRALKPVPSVPIVVTFFLLAAVFLGVAFWRFRKHRRQPSA